MDFAGIYGRFFPPVIIVKLDVWEHLKAGSHYSASQTLINNVVSNANGQSFLSSSPPTLTLQIQTDCSTLAGLLLFGNYNNHTKV